MSQPQELLEIPFLRRMSSQLYMEISAIILFFFLHLPVPSHEKSGMQADLLEDKASCQGSRSQVFIEGSVELLAD